MTYESIRFILFDSATVKMQGIPSDDYVQQIFLVIISIFAAIVGYLFIRMKRYFPENIKQWMKVNGKE